MKTAVAFSLRQTLGFFQRRDRPAAEPQSFLAHPKRPIAQQLITNFSLQPFIYRTDRLLILFGKLWQQHRTDFFQLPSLQQQCQIIQYLSIGRAGELAVKVVVDGFHIKHHAVAQSEQLGILPKINDAVGIDQTGFPGRLDTAKQRRQKISVKHTFPAADRNSLNKRKGFRNLLKQGLGRQLADFAGSVMGTDMDALIAACAAGFIPNHFSFTQSQRPGWAAGDALTAMIADLPGFRIVAVCAMQRAALEKNRAAVTGSVNVGKGNDPAYTRFC